MKTITATELKEQLNQSPNLELIDVRTPAEFGEVHVENARNIPLDTLKPTELSEMRKNSNDQPLYIICKSGGRGEKACKLLLEAGLGNAVNIEGGTDACVTIGLPVIHGKKAMSLERQVRIAAGALVLSGIGLGLYLHPGFYGLSALVGAGLIFAGITDWCGMGMLLAKMPWNQA